MGKDAALNSLSIGQSFSSWGPIACVLAIVSIHAIPYLERGLTFELDKSQAQVAKYEFGVSDCSKLRSFGGNVEGKAQQQRYIRLSVLILSMVLE